MGASSWITHIPEQGDLRMCLQAAKRRVFNGKHFVDPLGITHNPNQAIAALKTYELPPGIPPEDQEDYLLELREMRSPLIEAIEKYIKADSLDQKLEYLRQAVGFEGTHSILDIPNKESLIPCPTEALLNIFGAIRPAIASIKKSWQTLEKEVP